MYTKSGENLPCDHRVPYCPERLVITLTSKYNCAQCHQGEPELCMLCFVAPLPLLVEAGESEEQRPRCSPIATGTPHPSAGLVPSPAFCSYACLLMGFLPHHKNIRKITLANSFVCHSA